MSKKEPVELFRGYLAAERAEFAEAERKRLVAETARLERIAAAERERLEEETRKERERLEKAAHRQVELAENRRRQAKARLELLKLLWALKGQSQFVRIDSIDYPLASMFVLVVSHFDKEQNGPKEVWSNSIRFVKPRSGQDLGIVVGDGRRFAAISEVKEYVDQEMLRDMAKHVAACEAIRKRDGLRLAPAPVRARGGHHFGTTARRYGNFGSNVARGYRAEGEYSDAKKSLKRRNAGSRLDPAPVVEKEFLLAADESLADAISRIARKYDYREDGTVCIDGELTMFIRSEYDYWDTRERIDRGLASMDSEGEWCLLPVGEAGWGQSRLKPGSHG
jgi:hypothetical protein